LGFLPTPLCGRSIFATKIDCRRGFVRRGPHIRYPKVWERAFFFFSKGRDLNILNPIFSWTSILKFFVESVTLPLFSRWLIFLLSGFDAFTYFLFDIHNVILCLNVTLPLFIRWIILLLSGLDIFSLFLAFILDISE